MREALAGQPEGWPAFNSSMPSTGAPLLFAENQHRVRQRPSQSTADWRYPDFTASSVGKVVWTLVRQTAGATLEYVGVMEQAVEQCGDGGGVTEELPPVVDRTIRGEHGGGPFVAAHDQIEQSRSPRASSSLISRPAMMVLPVRPGRRQGGSAGAGEGASLRRHR